MASDIVLSFFLTKNNLPLSGEAVTVRVVDQITGAEILGSTSVPETAEPGLYSYLWTNPPALPALHAALYYVKNRIFAATDSLATIASDLVQALQGSRQGQIVGVIKQAQLAAEFSHAAVVGVLKSTPIGGTLTTDRVVGTIAQAAITGEISD